MYRNALRALLERSCDSWHRGINIELPSTAIAALQQALSTSNIDVAIGQSSSTEWNRDEESGRTSNRAASTLQPGCPCHSQRLPGTSRDHWPAGMPQVSMLRLHEPSCGLTTASTGQHRLLSAASGGGEGPGEGEHEGLPQGEGQAGAAHGKNTSADTNTEQRSLPSSSRDRGAGDEGASENKDEAGAGAGQDDGLLDTSADQQQGMPSAQRRLSDAEFMTSAPPTEPLNPSRRGSAAWEPFAAEDNSFEGLEVRGSGTSGDGWFMSSSTPT